MRIGVFPCTIHRFTNTRAAGSLTIRFGIDLRPPDAESRSGAVVGAHVLKCIPAPVRFRSLSEDSTIYVDAHDNDENC